MGRHKRKRRNHEPPHFEASRFDEVRGFFQAALSGEKAAIRQFLAAGGHIDERDRAGRTALMLYDLSTEMVKFLLSLKADPNAQDRSGHSVLAHQCIAPCIGFLAPDFCKIKVLLKAGASPDLCDNQGRDLGAQVFAAVCSGLEASHARQLMELVEEHVLDIR